MRVLLLRPVPGNDRFGLGPFFRIEPLGMEYIGPARFFELYCETWRRSVLNLRGRKSAWQWLRQVDLRNTLPLMRALARTQRMMDPAHYLAEYDRPEVAAQRAIGQLTVERCFPLPASRFSLLASRFPFSGAVQPRPA